MVRCPDCHASYPEGVSQCPLDGRTLLPDEAFAAADAPLVSGTMVGEYRVDKKLGAGTFGAVYAGEQPLIGKKVAIKVLHRKFSSDPEIVSRFIAEARAVNRIRHRHIIDIFSFGLLDDRQHYFVMELVDGLTLGELLKQKGRLSVAQSLPILRGIAAGLDAAHKAGVTHRDLKPDNIFLAAEAEQPYFPKLLDFGVAKLVTDDMAHKTATGLAIGTPRYMAPEQARGKKVDHRADIYALGVVIYQMLTGRCPFDDDSVMDLLLRHAVEPAPRMSSALASIPRALDEPVLAMLAKRPSARPDSAGEAVAALTACARELGLDREASPQSGLDTATTRLPAELAPAGGTVKLGEWVGGAAEQKATAAATVALGKEQGGAEHKPADAALSATVASDELQVDVSLGRLGLSATVSSDDLRTAAVPADSNVPMPSPRTARMPYSPDGTLLSGAASRGASADETGAGTAAASQPSREGIPGSAQSEAMSARRRWAWMALGAAGVALAGVIVGRSAPAQHAGSLPEPSATSSSPSTADSVHAPSVATIRLAVTPADAAVLVDGQYAGPASKPLVLPQSSERHTVRIERQGYEPHTLWLVPDREQELSPIVLAAVAPAPSAAPASLPPHRAVPPGEQTHKPSLHRDLQKPPELGGPN